MAGEITYRHEATGSTLYAVLLNAAGQVWNGSAFESYTVANWATYDIALSESPASSYRYLGDMPAATAGDYELQIYDQSGGSPAISDALLASAAVRWTGSAIVARSVDVASFQDDAITPASIKDFRLRDVADTYHSDLTAEEIP